MSGPPPAAPPPPGPNAPAIRPALDPYRNININLPPFPKHEKKFKTFEGWFNLLFSDCPNLDRTKYYKEVLTPDGKLKPDYETGHNANRRQVLNEMLDVAYEEFESKYEGSSDDLLKTIGKIHKIHVGFRGELRTPAQVELHQGCSPRAQIDALRRTMGMNEPWHPFIDPVKRNKMYFRKGFNKDNCLFTTVSVATDFETASKFPLLVDLKRDAPDAIGTATVLARGIESLISKKARKGGHGELTSAARRSQRRLVKCVRMNVYLFLCDRLWNTELKQFDSRGEQFPERAAKRIPIDRFLARVRCDRLQYGEDSNAGHLLVLHGYDLMQSDDKLRRLLGHSERLARLKQHLRELVSRGRLSGGSRGKGGIHYATANTDPTVSIDEVERIDARCDWF